MSFDNGIYPAPEFQYLIRLAMNGDDAAAKALDKLPTAQRIGAIALAYRYWLNIGKGGNHA